MGKIGDNNNWLHRPLRILTAANFRVFIIITKHLKRTNQVNSFQFHLNVDFSRSVVHLNVDTLVHLDILTSILIPLSTFHFRRDFKYLRAEVGVAGATCQQSVLTVLSIWNCGNWLSPHMAVVIRRACWKNQNLS